jgi:hypothetical protein
MQSDFTITEVLERARTMEGEVIHRLMSGNDAQCFTTEQYGEAVDAWIAETMCNGYTRQMCGIPDPPIERRRSQLIGCGIVSEVGPDVWTLKELTT